ncbi:hypothetical protein ACIQWA_36280 [Kitasatospora sp. NPDC098652]
MTQLPPTPGPPTPGPYGRRPGSPARLAPARARAGLPVDAPNGGTGQAI